MGFDVNGLDTYVIGLVDEDAGRRRDGSVIKMQVRAERHGMKDAIAAAKMLAADNPGREAVIAWKEGFYGRAENAPIDVRWSSRPETTRRTFAKRMDISMLKLRDANADIGGVRVNLECLADIVENQGVRERIEAVVAHLDAVAEILDADGEMCAVFAEARKMLDDPEGSGK